MINNLKIFADIIEMKDGTIFKNCWIATTNFGLSLYFKDTHQFILIPDTKLISSMAINNKSSVDFLISMCSLPTYEMEQMVKLRERENKGD